MPIAEVTNKIKTIMHENASIIKDEKSLLKSFTEISSLQNNFNPCKFFDNPENTKNAITAFNSIICAKAIIFSMVIRKESRGAHYRSDYPDKDDINWNKINCIKMDNSGNIKSVEI